MPLADWLLWPMDWLAGVYMDWRMGLARRRAGRQWLEEYRKLWRQTLRRRVRVSPNWWKVGS